MEKILIKFNNGDYWTDVSELKNKYFKEWLINECDSRLYENEIKKQKLDGNELFHCDFLENSLICNEYYTVDELEEIFEREDYKILKEKTLEYDRFFWLNIDELKRCFEPQDFEEIKKGCLGYEK